MRPEDNPINFDLKHAKDGVYYKAFKLVKCRGQKRPVLGNRFQVNKVCPFKRAGDSAAIKANARLVMCGNGFHASKGYDLYKWCDFARWREGQLVVYAVRLSGVAKSIGWDRRKVVARKCTLLRRVAFNSAEGRRVRRSSRKDSWEM